MKGARIEFLPPSFATAICQFAIAIELAVAAMRVEQEYDGLHRLRSPAFFSARLSSQSCRKARGSYRCYTEHPASRAVRLSRSWRPAFQVGVNVRSYLPNVDYVLWFTIPFFVVVHENTARHPQKPLGLAVCAGLDGG